MSIVTVPIVLKSRVFYGGLGNAEPEPNYTSGWVIMMSTTAKPEAPKGDPLALDQQNCTATSESLFSVFLKTIRALVPISNTY